MRFCKLLTVLLVGVFFQQRPCFAQTQTEKISDIKNYIKYIDSLISNDDQKIIRGISEGPIRVTSYIRKKTAKGFVSSKPNLKQAGFSLFTYRNASRVRSDTICKISYQDNIDKNLYENYYYRDKKLITANVYVTDNSGKFDTISRKDEYYDDGRIIFCLTTPPAKTKYNRRISFSLFEKGNKYLKEALDNNR